MFYYRNKECIFKLTIYILKTTLLTKLVLFMIFQWKKFIFIQFEYNKNQVCKNFITQNAIFQTHTSFITFLFFLNFYIIYYVPFFFSIFNCLLLHTLFKIF